MKSVQQAPQVKAKPLEVTITHRPDPARRASLEAQLAAARAELNKVADAAD